MDKQAFLAQVGEYHKNGMRLALVNVTTLVPVAAPAHGAKPAAAGEAPAAEAHAEAAPAADPDQFEITWAFEDDKTGKLETIREIISPADAVPSISEFFGAAFLYENEMRELFGIKVEGINLDLQGQLYKTATKIPFSHQAVKARLDAFTAKTAEAAAAKTPAAATTEPKA